MRDIKYGIFSKLAVSGGSEFRCAELCRGLLAAGITPYLFAAEGISDKVLERVPGGVVVFPDTLNHEPAKEFLQSLDSLLIVNTDSKSFTDLKFWQQHGISLAKIDCLTYLFNFLVSPSIKLAEMQKEWGNQIRIITTNRKFYYEISEQDRYEKVQSFPRMILESPIDPSTVPAHGEKVPTSPHRLVCGMYAKPIGNKWNEELPFLVRVVDEKTVPGIKWKFMGCPEDVMKQLDAYDNVQCFPQFHMPVKEFLADLDLFVYFPDWKREEPWSRCVGEALMAGCPVITTNKGGNPDQVLHGNNGYLCKQFGDFVKGIQRLSDFTTRIRLSENARRMAQSFSTENVIRRLLEFTAPSLSLSHAPQPKTSVSDEDTEEDTEADTEENTEEESVEEEPHIDPKRFEPIPQNVEIDNWERVLVPDEFEPSVNPKRLWEAFHWDIWDPEKQPLPDIERLPERTEVCFCTTLMDRLDDLKQTLPVNWENNREYERSNFIILDYNSRNADEVRKWLSDEFSDELESGRIRYFWTGDPDFYDMAHSRNLAFALGGFLCGRHSIVSNIDADNFIPGNLAEYLNALAAIQPDRALFVKGKRMTRGRIGMYYDEWCDLGGYDETLNGYGWDDKNIMGRAMLIGYRMMYYGGDFFENIHTSRKKRVANMEAKDYKQSEEENKRRTLYLLENGIVHPNIKPWGIGHLISFQGDEYDVNCGKVIKVNDDQSVVEHIG